MTATVGLAAAVGMRAAASGDQDLGHVAVQLAGDAERLLPEAVPTDDWYIAARALYTWTAVRALYGPDAELVPVALRVADRLEDVLIAHPGLAAGNGHASTSRETVARELETLRQEKAQLLAATGQPPGNPSAHGPADRPAPAPETFGGSRPSSAPAPEEARRLARRGLDQSSAALGRTGPDGLWRRPLAAAGRPEPAPLRGAMTDLHAALAGVFGVIDLRLQIDTALGLCGPGSRSPTGSCWCPIPPGSSR